MGLIKACGATCVGSHGLMRGVALQQQTLSLACLFLSYFR